MVERRVAFQGEHEGARFGAYSDAIAMGGVVYVSGQVGVDDSGQPLDGVEQQTRKVFGGLSQVLKQAGVGMADVVKFTTYLTDPEHLVEFNRVRDELFAEYYPAGDFPANSLLIVSRLVRPGLLVEVEAIAHGRPSDDATVVSG